MHRHAIERAFKSLLVASAVMALAPAALGQSASSGNQAPAKKPWYESIIFKGYIQLDATFPEGNNVTWGSVSNFRIRRARPTFIVPIDPLTRVQLQFDLGTGKSNSGASTVTVTDTFAERDIPRYGSVAFGQRLLPFSREVLEDNAAVRSPLELSYAAELLALSERDIGLFLRSPVSKPDPVHWELGVVNGQGFRTADANPEKTFAGRVVAAVGPWAHVGMSLLDGEMRVSGADWERYANGYEVQLKPCKAAVLTGEFYHAKFANSASAPTQIARFNGGYLLLESWIGSIKSIPYLRYQRTYGDLDYRSVDLGWRWQYTPTQRLTVEYDIVNGHQRDGFGARWQLNW